MSLRNTERMMQPPRHMRAIEGLLSFHLYSLAACLSCQYCQSLEYESSTHLLHQHEALSIRDDLGGIEGLLEVVKELVLVALEGVGAANKLELGRCLDTLVLDARQAAGQHSLGDEGDGHAQVKGVHSSPLAGTLLASLVEDLLD